MFGKNKVSQEDIERLKRTVEIDDQFFAVSAITLGVGDVGNDVVADGMSVQSFFKSFDNAVATVHINKRKIFGYFFDNGAVFVF